MTEPKKLDMDFEISNEELEDRIEAIHQEIEAMDPFDTKTRRNRIKCAQCKEIIESKFRHDFKYCACGAVFVDGGKDYCRLGGDFNDVIFVYDDDTEKPMSEVMADKTACELLPTEEDHEMYDAALEMADAQLVALDEYEDEMSLHEKYNSLDIRLTSLEATCEKMMRFLQNQADDGK